MNIPMTPTIRAGIEASPLAMIQTKHGRILATLTVNVAPSPDACDDMDRAIRIAWYARTHPPRGFSLGYCYILSTVFTAWEGVPDENAGREFISERWRTLLLWLSSVKSELPFCNPNLKALDAPWPETPEKFVEELHNGAIQVKVTRHAGRLFRRHIHKTCKVQLIPYEIRKKLLRLQSIDRTIFPGDRLLRTRGATYLASLRQEATGGIKTLVVQACRRGGA